MTDTTPPENKVDDNATTQTPPENKGDQANPAAHGLYRPEGMPDHYAGKDDRETIDRLFKTVDGFRKEQGKGKSGPKSADEYSMDGFSDDVKAKIFKLGDDGKDVVFEAMRPVFFKHGMSQEGMQELINGFAAAMGDKLQSGTEDGGENTSADFDYKTLGGPDAARPVIDGIDAWATGLKGRGLFDDKAMEEINLLKLHGDGLHLLQKMREAMGEKPLVPGKLEAGNGPDEITEETLQARVRDERYWKTKDPAFIADTQAMFEKFYNKAEAA